MLSLSLWRTIAEADIHDPIFKRVSQIHTPARQTPPRPSRPRLLVPLFALASTCLFILAPQLLAAVLIVPFTLVSLVVAAPLFLPVLIWFAGAISTGEIISGIQREKQQNTYDLICASTLGKLNASWSFATGMLHRGGYFLPLRWGTRITLRFGLAALGGLGLFVLLFALADPAGFGIAQMRLLLLPLLLAALTFSNLTQTFVVSHIVGLLASSFDWAKRDAMLVGLLAYAVLHTLPLAVAGLICLPFRWFVFEPPLLAVLAVEAFALLLIIAGR
ncbi:MAG: hypothetical protein OXG49_07630, partial [Chloroflexi bacterium]|nr:hypothetical protein [Chloroflexota bacterium]